MWRILIWLGVGVTIYMIILGVTVSRSEPGAPAPAPAAFVPFQVTQADYNAVRQFLMEQPAKSALPVLQWLEQREQEAQKAAQPAPAPEK
jgi:hypothetical protein